MAGTLCSSASLSSSDPCKAMFANAGETGETGVHFGSWKHGGLWAASWGACGRFAISITDVVHEASTDRWISRYVLGIHRGELRMRWLIQTNQEMAFPWYVCLTTLFQ